MLNIYKLTIIITILEILLKRLNPHFPLLDITYMVHSLPMCHIFLLGMHFSLELCQHFEIFTSSPFQHFPLPQYHIYKPVSSTLLSFHPQHTSSKQGSFLILCNIIRSHIHLSSCQITACLVKPNHSMLSVSQFDSRTSACP